MSLTGSIVLYVCVWWVVFFSLLPVGIKPNNTRFIDKISGIDPGAPKKANILKKFIYTTLITSIIFLSIYYMVDYKNFNLREYLN
mgnify:CR=1 FL=1|tara:strand:- start:177 stop:431 length:255 start_codon:yes stop_codon:yes gene_type:complete